MPTAASGPPIEARPTKRRASPFTDANDENATDAARAAQASAPTFRTRRRSMVASVPIVRARHA